MLANASIHLCAPAISTMDYGVRHNDV